MELGKHVYVEKPLSWSVDEARELSKRAAETKVVTQMGNQGHSLDAGARRSVLSGAERDRRHPECTSGRTARSVSGRRACRGPRPAAPVETCAGTAPASPRVSGRPWLATTRCRTTLAWDLFLGVAPHVDYHPVYHPFNWRGWVDWGAGPLGDMGAHLLDHPSTGRSNLGFPTTIETLSTPFNGVAFPHATTTYYTFPKSVGHPAVNLTWYDGGLCRRSRWRWATRRSTRAAARSYIGTKGKLLYETYGAKPRLLPHRCTPRCGTAEADAARIPDELHEMNFVDAAKGTATVSCPFEYTAKLTEVMLLGIVSLRAGRKIAYDAAHMRITNDEAANQFLKREPRASWTSR